MPLPNNMTDEEFHEKVLEILQRQGLNEEEIARVQAYVFVITLLLVTQGAPIKDTLFPIGLETVAFVLRSFNAGETPNANDTNSRPH